MSRWIALLLVLLLWRAGTGSPFVMYHPDAGTPCSISVSYDPDTGIRCATLETELDVSIYFEIPVFSQEGAGFSQINAFFQELSRSFFSPENETLASALEYASRPDAPYKPYYYRCNTVTGCQTEHLVSVSIGYDWYMGGVVDYGSDSYTFRTDTGELLRLTDLLEGSEEELKAQILDAVKEQDAGTGTIDLESLQEYALDDFEFYVDSNGSVWILFDKYEAADGAYGGFAVELPLPLKAPYS